jgi:anti-anti-sigma factor
MEKAMSILESHQPGSELSFTVSEHPAAAIVRVSGELDVGNVTALPELLGQLLRDSRAGRILLDLADVTFISAAGLRSLLMARLAVLEAGAHLTLCAPAPIVRRALTATGDHRHFHIQDGVEGIEGLA